MANLVQRAYMGISAGYQSFKRAFNDPGLMYRRIDDNERIGYYNLLSAYYENSVFDSLSEWNNYKSDNRLYRQTRAIFNPVRRLVSFYSSHVYKGRLSRDGKPFPDGTPLAIPFASDTKETLLAAIGQTWQWSNWLDGKDRMVRDAAKYGEHLIEVVDSLPRKKVTFQIRWPGFVDTDYLQLDPDGNVKRYAIEYLTEDDEGHSYVYRKEVDQNAFRYYKDGEPYNYGEGTSKENYYGFVPSVWVRHEPVDDRRGAPAIQGSLNKIDEANSLASMLHDEIGKILASPVLVTAPQPLRPLFGRAKKGPLADELGASRNADDTGREMWKLLRADPGSDMKKIAIQLGDSIPYIEKLLTEVENDFPELGMYEQLAQMSQITGPAAERLMGNVKAKLDTVSARHDQQTVKMLQMAVAMAGERVKRGDWGDLDNQQKKFSGFDLESYRKGDLDLEIMARPLFPNDGLEEANEELARNNAKVVKKQFGVPQRVLLIESGYPEEEVTGMLAESSKEQEEAVRRSQAFTGMGNPAASGQQQEQDDDEEARRPS